MGGRPLLALNLVAFPSKELPMSVLGKIMQGGGAMVQEAGASLLGGHSVEDPEPKYGLAVVGEVSPQRLFRNVGGRAGDKLVLTKPIGSGIVPTALKRKLAKPKEVKLVTEVMATLNRAAGEVLAEHWRSVHSATDVTGYGLLGHLLEMLDGSSTAARLEAAQIPMLDAAVRLAGEGVFPGGTRANLRNAGKKVRFHGALKDDEATQLIIADAQTSGGLLAAIAPRSLSKVMKDLESAGVDAAVIGELVEGRPRIDVY